MQKDKKQEMLTDQEKLDLRKKYYEEVNRMILEMKDLISDIDSFFNTGNRTAGQRARGRLLIIKQTCTVIRSELKPSNMPVEKLRPKYKNYGFKK